VDDYLRLLHVTAVVVRAADPGARIALGGLGHAEYLAAGQVALLEYHLHVPQPDPLTTADAEARSEFYGDAIPGTPTFFVDGRPGPQVGGPAANAREGYDDLTRAVNDALDQSREKAATHMGQITAGLGLPPGLL